MIAMCLLDLMWGEVRWGEAEYLWNEIFSSECISRFWSAKMLYWWDSDTDTLPPLSLVTYSHHGGILSWWEYAVMPWWSWWWSWGWSMWIKNYFQPLERKRLQWRKPLSEPWQKVFFLDTQVSLAPTHVSPAVGWLVRHTFKFPLPMNISVQQSS